MNLVYWLCVPADSLEDSLETSGPISQSCLLSPCDLTAFHDDTLFLYLFNLSIKAALKASVCFHYQISLQINYPFSLQMLVYGASRVSAVRLD